MFSSHNTSSGQRLFARSCKEGGGFEIAWKKWNTGDRQERGATL